jgi:MoaA/NifB/PqqE/SkfB family radical SAM enzyme
MPIKENMSFSMFKQIVDMCKGVKNFHLTPIVGESTLHKDIYLQLEYLSEKAEVEKIAMFTNFLHVDVQKLLSFKKLHLIISVYGDSPETYLKHTQKNNFSLFMKNMTQLYKSNFMNVRALEFFMRNQEFDYSSELGKMIALMVRCKSFSDGKGNFIHESFWNGNWCGEMQVENMRSDKKEGICSYAPINNSIDVNGDIILCGACDIKKTTVIGNIFKESFEDIYNDGPINKLFENQRKNIYEGCCAGCSEFHRGN